MVFTKRLIQLLKGNLLLITVAFLSAMLQVGLTVIAVFLVRQAVANILGNETSISLSLLGIFILLLTVHALRGGFLYGASALAHVVAYRVLATLRVRVYSHVSRLSHSYLVRQETGEITSRAVNDVETIELFVAHFLPELVVATAIPLGIIIALLVVNPFMALISLIPLPFILVLFYFYERPLRHSFRETRVELGKINSLVVDSIQGLPVIKSFTREKEQSQMVAERSWAFSRASIRGAVLSSGTNAMAEMLAGAGLALIIWFGGNRFLDGVLGLPDLFLFIIFSLQIYRPILDLNRTHENLQNSIAASERIYQLLDTQPDIEDKPKLRAPESRKHDVELDDVVFAYEPDKPVLRHVSFKIGEGEVVALVGPSGAGKTTVANLLVRFWDPQEGSIRLGEEDLRELPISYVRSQISLVLQDVFLFNDTVVKNIQMGHYDATYEEVIAAAKAANAHDFISKELTNGYDTIIGERGARLSGGQKQRISIARAILKDAPILVLDEATSSVDPESEYQIQQALDRLAAKRTILVIAHRLSTIRKANRIVVLDRGEVMDVGTHEELLKRPGLYNDMYRTQVQAREWQVAQHEVEERGRPRAFQGREVAGAADGDSKEKG